MHIAKWAALLSIFWLLLSGYIQPLLLGFGVISIAIVLVVLKRMDAVDQEPRLMSTGYQSIRYLIWLMGQIVNSSIQVTRLIWGSSGKISPALGKIKTDNIPSEHHALYANSITLTPGTLSVDLEDGKITVHALQKSSIDELKEGKMAEKITSIWGDNK